MHYSIQCHTRISHFSIKIPQNSGVSGILFMLGMPEAMAITLLGALESSLRSSTGIATFAKPSPTSTASAGTRSCAALF